MRPHRSSALAALLILAACSRPDSRPAGEAASTDTTARPAAPVAAPVPARVDTAVAAAPAPAPPPAPKPQPAPARPTTPAVSPTPAPAPPPAPAAAVADPYHPAPRDTLDADTYDGWKQFELNCSRCHGEYGVGTSFAPALVVSLKDDGTIPTQELFITTVCAGRPEKGMPGWCALGLEMDKIQRIYKYLKGRADGKIAAGRPGRTS